MRKYNYGFYEDLSRASNNTEYVATKVYELLETHFSINTIVDIGCGIGTWLNTFKKISPNSNILGVDGNWVSEEQLIIPKECFVRRDLRESLNLKGRYDIVQTLEVAEHLPPERAESFVSDITKLSDLVLFSAAIPYQGGVGHINEQWLSYWVNLFSLQGYHFFDVIRWKLWNDSDICELHYKQNIVLFAKEGTAAEHQCEQLRLMSSMDYCDIVHPQVYINSINDNSFSIRKRLINFFKK